MTAPERPRWGLSCGGLLVPALLWNLALADRLPPSYQAAVFWQGVPPALAVAENGLRLLVFALPFAMPLELDRPGARRALAAFVAGSLVYAASWLPLMLAPEGAWARSAAGFLAPAYTPALWLLPLARLGRRLWGTHRDPRRAYALLVLAFLACHLGHAAWVFVRAG